MAFKPVRSFFPDGAAGRSSLVAQSAFFTQRDGARRTRRRAPPTRVGLTAGSEAAPGEKFRNAAEMNEIA